MRHPDCRSLGRIQAERVMAPRRFSDAAAGTRTTSPVPWNRSASPNRPPDAHVAPMISPALPLPEVSAAKRPDPLSRAYAPTRPAACEGRALPIGVVITARTSRGLKARS